MRRAVPMLGAVALVLGLASAAASPPRDFAAVALNVLPPGQSGSLNFGTNATDQLRLYDGLTPLFDRVGAADVNRMFKRAPLGLGAERAVRVERTPRPGVRIVRDRWGVPHVTGRTRADVEYGAGWVTAQDRGLLMNLLRGPGRISALDVPGIDAFALVGSGREGSRARRRRRSSPGRSRCSATPARADASCWGTRTRTSRASTPTTGPTASPRGRGCATT
jgi:hypothetical protein